MALDFRKAAQLCTDAELALVKSARAEEVRALAPKRLHASIARARNLRDKFRDLARRQVLEERRKASSQRRKRAVRGSARTVYKAELFAEVLRRFEAREAILRPDETSTPDSGKPARSPKRARVMTSPARPPSRSRSVAPKSRQRGTNGALRRKSEVAAAPRKRAQILRSNAPRVRAHAASRNRRSQGRRDAR